MSIQAALLKAALDLQYGRLNSNLSDVQFPQHRHKYVPHRRQLIVKAVPTTHAVEQVASLTFVLMLSMLSLYIFHRLNSRLYPTFAPFL